MTKVSWPQVILILGMMGFLMTGTVILVLMDKDVTIILSIAGIVAVPVLSALGVAVYQKLGQVTEQANGNLVRAMDLAKQNQNTATETNSAVLARVLELLEKNQAQMLQIASVTMPPTSSAPEERQLVDAL